MDSNYTENFMNNHRLFKKFKYLGPLDILKLTETNKLIFDPNLKLLTEYTKYDSDWIIGQVNHKGKLHGIGRKIN